MILQCIPDYREAEKWDLTAKKYNLAFEYNEFFNPLVLEDKELTENIIRTYESLGRDMTVDTMHGAFFDITVGSSDPLIRNASDYRVRQSLDIASRMGLRGVVFHTNYLTDFKSVPYRDSWVESNTSYWDNICSEYPGVNVYLENMFDESPELLGRVADNLASRANFGVCLDIAHAFLSSVALTDWITVLSPHIRHLHINDNDKVQDLHLAVGAGKLDWSVLKTEELFLSDPSVLIEVSGMEKLLESLKFLRSVDFI